ncbi:MAG: hypothetical protein H6703_00075 [Myxococcales bacterium]|nr:hypothetical protein [Myxococcales bacterium]
MRMTRWALAAGLALGLAGCGGDGVVRRVDDLPEPPPGAGYVEIKVQPPTADLYVDGVYRGRMDGYRDGVVRMPEGQRRIALRKNGHYSFYGTYDVGAATVRIEATLLPEVP